MRLSTACWRVSVLLAPPAILCSLLLYLYPLFLGCSFPEPAAKSTDQCILDSNIPHDVSQCLTKAPFRLLALGDPQLEGDSSLPDPDDPIFPHFNSLWSHIHHHEISGDLIRPLTLLKDIFRKDIPLLLWSYRKRLDLWGNDRYLAHIYRTLHWWLNPTHVTVLGDLLGSQWVDDTEFARRSARFWDVVFRHGRRVDHSASGINTTEPLGQDPAWARRVINVVGNHDIGYSGDIDLHRLSRFEDAFGKANWEIKFKLPARNLSAANSGQVVPELRLVILNNMLLDSPALDWDLQTATYDFMNDPVVANAHPVEDRTAATVLLTHIPLHKKAGVCKDGAFFDFGPYGIKEQNHLSLHSSKIILESIYGMSGNPNAPALGTGRNGIILTGHDHEGCDVLHYMPPESERDQDEWSAVRWDKSMAEAFYQQQLPNLREVTVRSMMGSFGGNAGLLSGWFDGDIGEWRFEYATCSLGVQHIWWAVHVLDLITLLFGVATALVKIHELLGDNKAISMPINKREPQKLAQRVTKPHMNGHAVTSARSESPATLRRGKKKKKKTG